MACGGDGAFAHAQRLWSELKDTVYECWDGPLDPKVPRILAELGPKRIVALQDADEDGGGPITEMLRADREQRMSMYLFEGTDTWETLEQKYRVTGQLLAMLQDAGVHLRGPQYAEVPHDYVIFCRLGMDMTGIDITTELEYDWGGGMGFQEGDAGLCPWDPNFMGRRARTPETITDADMEETAPSMCGQRVVRAMLDAGADMWPFHLPGVDRDHPVSRGDIKHEYMAAIVWPGVFPDLDEQIAIEPHDNDTGSTIFGFQADTGGGLSRWLFAYFAKKRERLRRQANWDRRCTALMCLLRHAAGGVRAPGGRGGRVAKKKMSGAGLDGVASMMIRLHVQQVAIREIIVFL